MFKGDLKHINLADIFQTLAMNQQEGTLTITAGEKRTDIYFSKEGVRLLTTGGRKYPLLGELLLKNKKLTPVELDMALARQRMTGELLGQALIDMNVVTEEIIEDCVSRQIEEEIYDVFSWRGALFSFTPGEPIGPFFDPAKLGKPITFNVNGIIMEAVRRIDEWEMVHKYIPHVNTIYALRDSEAAIPDISHLGFSTTEIFQIVELTDGRSTVEDIVEKAPFGRFEVCKILSSLVEARYIEKLDLKQTVHIADKLYRGGDKTGAIKIYRDALIDHPEDSRLHLKLAELYEKDEMKNEAAIEYSKVAESLIAQGSYQEALNLFKKSIELSPRNFSIRQKLFQFYLSQQELELAAAEGLFVARTYWRMNRLDDAVDTLQQIVELVPENIEVHQMLISVLADQQQFGKVLDHYERVAELYTKQGNEEGLIETYRKILTIDKNRFDIKNKLNALLSKQRKQSGTRGRKTVLILVIILIAFGALLLLFCGYEVYARIRIAGISSTVGLLEKEKQENKTQPDALEEKYIILRNEIDKFRNTFKFTILVLTSGKIDSLARTVKESIEIFEKKRNQEREARTSANEAIYNAAREADKNKTAEEALSLYMKVDRELLGSERGGDVNSRIKQLEKYIHQAKICYEGALSAEKEGNYQEAHKKYLDLIRNYSKHSLTKDIKLPLVIESEPPGADIIIGGKSYGKTPQIIKRPPDEVLNLVVIKEGYSNPEPRNIDSLACVVRFKLDKVPHWIFSTNGYLEAAVVTRNKEIYAGTQCGVIYCITQDKGTKLWESSPGSVLSQYSASPRIIGNTLYIGSLDQYIYALNIQNGALDWEFRLDSMIRSTPSTIDVNGVFYVGCDDSYVYAINPTEKKITGKFKTANKVFSNPVINNDVVYFGSNDFKCYAVDTKTLKEIWSYSTGGAVTTTPVVTENTVFFTSQDYSIYALSTKKELEETEQRLLWRYKTDKEITSSPVISEGKVYFGSTDKKMYCLDVQGKVVYSETVRIEPKEIWTYQCESAIMSTPAISDRVVYFGCTDGAFYALDAKNGEPIWKYKTGPEQETGKQSEIIGSAVVTDKYVIFSATDSKIYCFLK
ncbi:MAG: PQQ-binding-like beta-propeller repeat protein [Planctomycetota bacterium]